jgi:hypothetical protein
MAAAPYVAVAAILASIAITLKRCHEAFEKIAKDNAFDNAANAAKGLAYEIARANGELERQIALRDALGNAADAGKAAARATEAANLETERQTALASSGSAEEDARINAEFDRRRAEMERRHALEDAASARAADESAKSDNAARRGQYEAQIQDLGPQIADAIEKSMKAAAAEDKDEAARWKAIADDLVAQGTALRGKIAALDDADKVIDARLAGDYGAGAAEAKWRESEATASAGEARSARDQASRDSEKAQADALRERLATIEKEREEALAALAPDDAMGRARVNADYDRRALDARKEADSDWTKGDEAEYQAAAAKIARTLSDAVAKDAAREETRQAKERARLASAMLGAQGGSDSLARIGGYVGGTGGGDRAQAERERQTKILERIARAAESGGGDGAVLG